MKKIMLIIFGMSVMFGNAVCSPAWFTGKITNITYDLRSSPSSVYVHGVGSAEGEFNMEWLIQNRPDYWPYVYGLITNAYNKNISITFEYEDSTMQVRFVRTLELH